MNKVTTRNKRFKKVEKMLFLHPEYTQTSYRKLNGAVENIQGDKYYPIVDLHYFRQMTFEEIIAATGFTKQAAYKYRDRLICRIIDALYADGVMKETVETREDAQIFHIFFCCWNISDRRDGVQDIDKNVDKTKTKVKTIRWIVKNCSAPCNCTYGGSQNV